MAALALGPALPASAQLDLSPLEKLIQQTLPQPTTAPAPAAPAPAPAPAKPPAAKAQTKIASQQGGPAAAAAAAPVLPLCGPVPTPPRIRRTHGGNTTRLIELAKPLVDRGMDPRQALVLATPPFPVAGRATYTDDWMNPRTTPCPHLHQGTDIFADFGTPIVASGPGTLVAMGREPVGGNALWVAGDDGNSFYYAHLQKFADGVHAGQRVEKGTVMGEVGNTGNADGGAPHVHFEIHPPIRSRKKGIVSSGVNSRAGNLGATRTAAANPVGYLNIMIEQAESNVPALIDQLAKSQAPLLQLGRSGNLITLGQALPASDLRFGQPLVANQGVAKTAIALGLMALVTILAAFVTSWRLLHSRSRARKEPGPTRPLIERPSHQLI